MKKYKIILINYFIPRKIIKIKGMNNNEKK